MIMRTWNALATEAGSRDFARYFTTHALPRLQDLEGFLGAYLLDREGGDLVCLTVLTLWESLEALDPQTGTDPDAAIIEPEAMACLLDFDAEVTHLHVAAKSDAISLPVVTGGQITPSRHRAVGCAPGAATGIGLQ